MRKLLAVFLFVLILIGSPYGWATASWVGGAKNDATGSVTTITVTYSPTAGNTLVIFLETAPVSGGSCADNNSNALTVGPTISATEYQSSYYGTAITGATSYTCTWTTSTEAGIVLGEYSGVSSVNASLSGNTNSGNSATASVTVTTQDANDWIACGLGDSSDMLTGSVGTQREQVAASTKKITLVDNTSSSAGSLTCAATLTSTGWVGIALELRTTSAVSVSQFDKRRKLTRLGVL